MRDYSFNVVVDKWQLYFNYITQLDQQIWNLYDYIKEYNPNYQILNDSNNYYTLTELEQLALYDSNTTIINASYLNQHQGIVNNFHKRCIINFASNTNQQSIIIPAINKYIVIDPKNVQYQKVSDPTLQYKTIYDFQWYFDNQIVLPEGYILLSQVKSDDWSKNSIERGNIKNYLLARVAAPATYYVLNQINAQMVDNIPYTTYTWLHVPNAELTYGISQYYSFLPNGVNFSYYQNYNNKSLGRQSVDIAGKDIKTEDGSQWVNGYNLDHRLINHNAQEEIICDDTRLIHTEVEENQSMAYYRITIPNVEYNDNEPFLEKFPMMVRLW